MNSKRKKIVLRVIAGLAVVFLLWTGFVFYSSRTEGGPGPKYKDTALKYVLAGDHIGLRSEDSTMERSVIFYNKATDETILTFKIFHYRYKACEERRIGSDGSDYQEYVISDMSTIREFAHRIFSTCTTDSEKVRQAVNFTRYIGSTSRKFEIGTDIPKYVLQTIYDGEGTSADKSVMLATILKLLGYKAVLLYDADNSVMYTGIALAEEAECSYISYENERYGVIDVCDHISEIGYASIDPAGLQVVTGISDVNSSLRYYDERVKENPYGRDENNVRTVDYSMKKLFLHPFADLSLDINTDDYEYYSSLPREKDLYVKYFSGEKNQEAVRSLVNKLLDKYTDSGSSEWYRLSVIVNFVHNIPYIYDTDSQNIEDYAQYPIETLYRNSGDCEDHAILMAAALRELGYDCRLVYYYPEAGENKEPEGHVTVAVKDKGGLFSGAYYDINGEKYYALETTQPWNIGSLGEEYINACAVFELRGSPNGAK